MKASAQICILALSLLIMGACSLGEIEESMNKIEFIKAKKEDTKKADVDARDIDSLLSESTRLNKPLLICFTAYNCVNCLQMEERVLLLPEIEKRLNEEFIFASFYVDSKVKLKKEEYFVSTRKRKIIKTVGDINYEYEVIEFDKRSQPTFVGLNGSSTLLSSTTYEKTNTSEDFNSYLDEVLTNFQK